MVVDADVVNLHLVVLDPRPLPVALLSVERVLSVTPALPAGLESIVPFKETGNICDVSWQNRTQVGKDLCQPAIRQRASSYALLTFIGHIGCV